MNKNTATRALSLLLALMMTITVFTGCTNGGTAKTGETKTITVQVVHKDGTAKDFTITTETETLRAALEQENLVEGDESEYGLYIKTVDGETVDEANQEWWCLTQGGEMTSTGADGIKIADGDTYELTLTVGY